MPPATAGPGPIIDAPRAATPLTVRNSRLESNSQMTDPSVVEYALSTPSFDPEKIAPGIAVSAADCAALHPRPLHFGGCGAAYQARSPVANATACSPPGCGRRMSETAK